MHNGGYSERCLQSLQDGSLPISHERSCRESARCEEGQLVTETPYVTWNLSSIETAICQPNSSGRRLVEANGNEPTRSHYRSGGRGASAILLHELEQCRLLDKGDKSAVDREMKARGTKERGNTSNRGKSRNAMTFTTHGKVSMSSPNRLSADLATTSSLLHLMRL